MSDNTFYSDFEDKYRGSRSLITQRLAIYLEFLTPMTEELSSRLRALDLGCGRGEWLELLSTLPIDAYGIDTDPEMIATCSAFQLKAVQAEALEHLLKQDDSSLDVISGFHIAEHLEFSTLRAVIKEALRALKPGGLLILETPNPENILVATKNFYLDPTHVRPLPPELLTFTAEHAGFYRVKVLRLQEDPTLTSKDHLRLHDVLSGVSPDYAIVAQKHDQSGKTTALDTPFAKNYGISLLDVESQYDENLQKLIAKHANQSAARQIRPLVEDLAQKMSQIQDQTAGTHEKVETLSSRLQELSSINDRLTQQISIERERFNAISKDLNEHQLKLQAAQEETATAKTVVNECHRRIDDLNHSSHHWYTESKRLQEQLDRLYGSYSWKISAPLRTTLDLFAATRRAGTKVTTEWLMAPCKRTVKKMILRPTVAPRIEKLLRHSPRAHACYVQFLQAEQMAPFGSHTLKSTPISKDPSKSAEDVPLNAMTPNQRRYFLELKASLKRKAGDN